MELEVVNITKIKDGFFLGDEGIASNLDIIVQFKISHMINAAGLQVINAWESIGVKYLTLNWNEVPSQNLFDQKYEIANRIVSFIDDCSRNGEGILIHSFKGQNRACIVAIIYFIKKYRWSLTKTIEFLRSKKFDVNIPKYFLNQLSIFESYLLKIGQGPKSNTWEEGDVTTNDPDERILRNTYINGFSNFKANEHIYNPNKRSHNYTGVSTVITKLTWADSNNKNRKDLLCIFNLNRDLLNQKEIKPVVAHKKLQPKKSCFKKLKNNNEDDNKDNSKIIEDDFKKSIIKSSSSLLQFKPDIKDIKDNSEDNERPSNYNSFIQNNSINSSQVRPNSVDVKPNSVDNKPSSNINNLNIINKNYFSNHPTNISNIYTNNIYNSNSNTNNNHNENQNSMSNPYLNYDSITNEGNETNNNISGSLRNIHKNNNLPIHPNLNSNLTTNTNNMPSIINNNYINFYIQSPSQEIDKKDFKENISKYNNYLNPTNNERNNLNSNKMLNDNLNPFKNINGLNNNNMTFNKNIPVSKNVYLNAYSQSKKQQSSSANPSSGNSIKIPNINIIQKSQKSVGPIKITNNGLTTDKKSDQLINNLSTIKYKQPILGAFNNTTGKPYMMNDTIKRSNSKQNNDNASNRPSTAPSKEDKDERSLKNIYNPVQKGSNKRLPSPHINPSNFGSNKQQLTILPSYGKRQPSPQVKSNIGLNNTYKPPSKNYLK